MARRLAETSIRLRHNRRLTQGDDLGRNTAAPIPARIGAGGAPVDLYRWPNEAEDAQRAAPNAGAPFAVAGNLRYHLNG